MSNVIYNQIVVLDNTGMYIVFVNITIVTSMLILMT